MARRAITRGTEGEHSFCPVTASIEILQEKWSLHIIRRLLDGGEQGFNELRRSVGANPATLTERLEHLEELGIVRRTVHSLMPPRTSYALTPAGVALSGVINAISDWGREYLDQSKGKKGLVAVRKAG
ncbi:MAG: helix-turn-helix transcriptional regulator [Gemmatimonadetes bacterium]|nr:helix-turn-helix transcriptional regulator [Gemmatimonadota bacterium]